MLARLAAIAGLLGATSCGTGERAFRMVQFCLAGPEEIGTLKDTLRGVAAANKLPFYDNSEQTEAELKSIAEVQKNTPVAHPTINVGTVGPTAMGFSAGNFAEAPSQIVVGFSKGGDLAAARKLSDTVVQALSRRWRIHEVPNVEASGAFPLKDCNS
jgi:hypothetical protein